jgi:hypothetical protein
MKTMTKMDVALLTERIVKLLMSSDDPKLTKEDDVWIDLLQQYLGRDSMVVADPDNPHREKTYDCKITREKLNENLKSNLLVIHSSLKVLIDASTKKYKTKDFGEYNLPIHNSLIHPFLKKHYSVDSFKELFDFCEDKGTFVLPIEVETGLVKTTEIESSENEEMALRQWITDNIRCGETKKVKYPLSWPRVLHTIGKFYMKPRQIQALEKAISDRDSYARGGVMAGVPHIFMSDTLQRDSEWFNNKRLESHGLAFKAFCDTIIDGIVYGRVFGFFTSEMVSEEIIKSIVYLANYFEAINYPYAPSAGNWEESPFEGGLTWDTEVVRSAYASLKNLCFNERYGKYIEIQKIRERLRQAPRGEIVDNEAKIQNLIDIGKERVLKYYDKESPQNRELDASLVFVTTSNVRLTPTDKELDEENLVLDITNQMSILQKLEKGLVRDKGILRYEPFNFTLSDGTIAKSPDSYLNLNYNIAIDKDGYLNLAWKEILDHYGSKDAADPEVFNARSKLSTPQKEAEWFMVSDMAYGYAAQMFKLIKGYRSKDDFVKNKKRVELLKACFSKACEYINRGYARITGTESEGDLLTKANGQISAEFAVPEAYQHVTSLNEDTVLLIGVNSPLSWAMSSLFKASTVFRIVINKLDRLGILVEDKIVEA